MKPYIFLLLIFSFFLPEIHAQISEPDAVCLKHVRRKKSYYIPVGQKISYRLKSSTDRQFGVIKSVTDSTITFDDKTFSVNDIYAVSIGNVWTRIRGTFITGVGLGSISVGGLIIINTIIEPLFPALMVVVPVAAFGIAVTCVGIPTIVWGREVRSDRDWIITTGTKPMKNKQK